MKFRILSLFLALTFIAPNAFSADGSSGCGAGWYILKSNSLISSFTRTITNVMLSNTIGMTFGTSNCAKHSIVKNDFKAIHFSESTFDQIQIELAMGQGPHVWALGDLMGCQPSAMGQFQDKMKSSYNKIFPANKTAPHEMLKNMKGSIESDEYLSKNCLIM